MGTPHNHAQKGEIAGKVLMPGDPLRAKFIAETYLENPVCFNTVRNMLGYTGTYRGEPVSVMGGGMGMPSIGIYSYELFHMYDVETIIRVGSAGGIQENVNLGDVVVAAGACTDSNYGYQYQLPGTFAPIASFDLAVKAAQLAAEQEIPCHVGNVLSSDIFYNEMPVSDSWKKMGVLCVEMEIAALYMNAAAVGRKALGLLTISDHLYREEAMSPEERQLGFGKMIEIALKL